MGLKPGPHICASRYPHGYGAQGMPAATCCPPKGHEPPLGILQHIYKYGAGLLAKAGPPSLAVMDSHGCAVSYPSLSCPSAPLPNLAAFAEPRSTLRMEGTIPTVGMGPKPRAAPPHWVPHASAVPSPLHQPRAPALQGGVGFILPQALGARGQPS